MENKQPLPQTSYIQPRKALMEGFKREIKKFGDLQVPIEVIGDFLSRETFLQKDKGATRLNKRHIVVRMLNEKPSVNAIGDITSGNFDRDTLEDSIFYGWVEDTTFEVSVWSIDATDRDNLRVITKQWMTTLLHQMMDTGSSYFTQQGVFSFKYQGSTDAINQQLIDNGVMHIGIMTWVLTSVFNFENREQYERFQYNITAQIINYDQIEI